MSEKSKPRGLGRGLSALMADVRPDPVAPESARRPDLVLPIEKLSANPNQPRRSFDEGDLEDLANSIREKGIIQPLIVRPRPNAPDDYEIVAGERRWRAAQMAQLHQVPVLIRDLDDTEVLEIAIIENIQRADLNAMEEAIGYRQLMDRFGHTQERLSQALGKSRSHIANLLRLLTLPDDVQGMIRDGQLSAGHARALITSENASDLAKKVAHGGLSVRATEALVKQQSRGETAPKPRAEPRVGEKDADTRALEADLSAALGMTVSIDHKPGAESGRLVVSYDTLDQLDDLCGRLSR